MRASPLFLGLLALGVSSQARAGDCAAPYGVNALLADLVAVEGSLRSGDDASAGATAKKLEAGLACLDDVMPLMIVGRAYRAVGAGLVVSGSEARGEQWFRTAAEVEQGFEYGLEDLPAEHPVRAVYARAKADSSGERVAVENAALASGGGTWFLDGRDLTEPAARLGRPHVLQLKGEQVLTWLIEGNDFPIDAIAAAAPAVAEAPVEAPEPAKAKKEKAPKPEKVAKVKEPKPEKVKKEKAPKPEKVARDETRKQKKVESAAVGPDGTLIVKRERPWEKTPLMIAGGAILAGAGGLYYGSIVKHQQFQDSNSEGEIEELQLQTNRLVIASAAVLAVGAGTLTWGVILDGGTALPAVRVRF